MNANELADYMDYLADDWRCEGFDDKEPRLAATMLRQLQAENEALKADNKRLKGFCWETDEAIEFLKAVKGAQEKC